MVLRPEEETQMSVTRTTSWGEGEFYELLCLMMIGTCVWIAGTMLGLFGHLSAAVLKYDLSDFVLLCVCMSLGVVAASVRKSLKLRREMLARDRAEAQADEMARHDPLTGLANRRLFKEVVEAKLRAAGSTGAVLLVDLDRFKTVNDVHGHPAGDMVLLATADRLRAVVAQGSAASSAAAARLGADEFALFVPHDGNSEALGRLAQEVITKLSAPVAWGRTQLEVGATVGVALAPLDGADAEALLHAADLAMYRGKKEGRGTFRFFEPSFDKELKARAQLEAELRTAVAKGEIEPYYQPVVSLSDRAMIGFEVLARWRHPTRGVLAPSHFIPVAEETGLIAELSCTLLRRACLDARNWPAHLQLAFNVAPQQLQDPAFAERILAILTETGFAPGRLEVEVTETALANDMDSARSTLESLRNLGVSIALDDFGTGYSSLYYLREIRFDKVKIDRSFVQSLPDSTESMKIVDAIMGLARSLDLLTTAEGIETPESLAWLAEQGCRFGQGYLFGRPMSASAADQLLQKGQAGNIIALPAAAA
jgi:diguanylate cyclase (GGDEF)-like protein